jgi:hypothetical protein
MCFYLHKDLELSPQKEKYIGSSICIDFLMVTNALQHDDIDIVLQDVLFPAHGYLYNNIE